ncbi:MAG: hypothetical protein AB7E32_08490 [Desulfovibrio sp.]
MSDETQTNHLTKEQRLTAYLDALERLRRERTSLREVLEREILLAFIRINRNNLNEFPLLETQQHSVIGLLCQRSDHPTYDYINKLTGNFLVLLNRLAKALPSGDETVIGQTRTRLLNTETLLIKCMQGIIYASGLITDNFEELVLSNYGETALPAYNELLKTHELDRTFWRDFLQRYVADPVAEAHEAILAENRFAMSKDGKVLIVRFYMDDVLSRLTPSDKRIEKTRIQNAFEERSRGYEGRRTLRLVTNCLMRGLSFIPREQLGESDLESLARIACVDDVSQQFRKNYQERLQRKDIPEVDPEEEAQHKLNFAFLMEQVVSTGVGALIGVTRAREEFSSALTEFILEQSQAMQLLGKDLSLDNLQRVVSSILEDHFVYRLQRQIEEEGNKIQIHKTRTRRAATSDVDALFPYGLTRIRKSKLWRKDASRDDMLLFRPRNAQELAGICRMLQIEPQLLSSINALWEANSCKVEILLTIDLALMARRTTNLALRLRELLTRIGLVRTDSADARLRTPAADSYLDAEVRGENARSRTISPADSPAGTAPAASESPSERPLEPGAAWAASPPAGDPSVLVAKEEDAPDEKSDS